MPKRKSKDVASGWIYYIQCETTRRVKIGWTMLTPPDRLMALKTGSPTKLRVLTAQPGRYDIEFRVHAELSKSRLHGEWFEYSLAVQRHIERVQKIHGAQPWVPPEERRPVETAEQVALRQWHRNQYLNAVEAGEVTFSKEDYLHEAMAWGEIRMRRQKFPTWHSLQKPDVGDMIFGGVACAPPSTGGEQ